MVYAYASIWRCLMHDIIIEIREKHVRTLSAHKNRNENNCQPLYREYMKGEEGGLVALAPPPPPPPPRSQRNEKMSNKMDTIPNIFSCVKPICI